MVIVQLGERVTIGLLPDLKLQFAMLGWDKSPAAGCEWLQLPAS
jgi:hypothetical protein